MREMHIHAGRKKVYDEREMLEYSTAPSLDLENTGYSKLLKVYLSITLPRTHQWLQTSYRFSRQMQKMLTLKTRKDIG